MGAISQINLDAQKANIQEDKNFLNKRYSHQVIDDSLDKKQQRVAQMGNSAGCKMKEGNEEEGLGFMVNQHEFRGDETPEEKLKYARLQTEGYQDDGYQESEDVSQSSSLLYHLKFSRCERIAVKI